MTTAAVLLHGFLGSPGDWGPVVRGLPADVPLLTPALPGHDAGGDAVPADLESWIDLARAPIAGRRYHLAGYSLGGRIALRWALRYPEEIASLCLVSSSPGVEAAADREARVQRDAEWARRLRGGPREAFLRAWYAQPVFASLASPPALLESIVQRRALADPVRLADCLERMSPGRLPHQWAALATLGMPVLWIAGGEDALYVPILRRAAGLCARGELRIVPHSGHAVHEEQPDVLAGHLREWWSRNA